MARLASAAAMLLLLNMTADTVTGTTTTATTATSNIGLSGFVTRQGSRLLLGGEDFRFGGGNCYWLGLDENEPPNTVAYPTPFRVVGSSMCCLLPLSSLETHSCHSAPC